MPPRAGPRGVPQRRGRRCSGNRLQGVEYVQPDDAQRVSSSSISKLDRSQRRAQARTCRSSSSSKLPAMASRLVAAMPGSEMAGPVRCRRATSLSTVTGSSLPMSMARSWAIQPGSTVRLRSQCTGRSPTNTRVLAASAMRMCDWVVSAISSSVSSSAASARSGWRWRPEKLPVASTPLLSTVPSSAERTSIRPDQSSATIVVSQPAQMLMLHVHEPALGKAGGTVRSIPEPNCPDQHAPPHVEVLPVLKYVDGFELEPRAVVDPEGERQPVGQVDDALVLYSVAVHHIAEPVVTAGRVGARVMDVPGARFGGGTTGGEVAIADGAQRLALAFLVRLEVLVAERPGSHRSGSAEMRSFTVLMAIPFAAWQRRRPRRRRAQNSRSCL